MTQFCERGQVHDVTPECDATELIDLFMVRIDSKTLMKVRRFKWKFRENHIILVDGRPFEVFWDAPPRTTVVGNPSKMAGGITILLN
ncbi:unnamed protein product [Lupinus luteus]|uniref:Uncharacterized protein n=1 Tax=Lupinus luteus TaxID=3873 RepID=A0AAV1XP43_LUPLU